MSSSSTASAALRTRMQALDTAHLVGVFLVIGAGAIALITALFQGAIPVSFELPFAGFFDSVLGGAMVDFEINDVQRLAFCGVLVMAAAVLWSDVLKLDSRLIGMLLIMVATWLVFDIVSGSGFLTARNLYNLSIQTASVAVMAAGMVFVIVTRHIDLSVGSLLGFVGMLMAVVQVYWIPDLNDSLYGGAEDSPLMQWRWLVTILAGVIAGAIVGAFQGAIVAYFTVPAFIVTVGGLLIWRGCTWWLTTGQTTPLRDQTFLDLGGRPEGSLGEFWSWVVCAVAVALVVALLYFSRRRKISHGFPVKPVWAEFAVGAALVAIIVGFVALMVSYQIPVGAARRMMEARGETVPEEGLYHGVAGSVVIVIAVALVMTVIARRTRFGRYVFATGGNPDAAELSGVNTKMLTVKVFALMGVLTAISAVIASARLTNATNDLGVLDELRVIAASVIGGTALAGGSGTIYGAMLGAVFLQSLQSGMVLTGVDAPLQNIVVGVVLVVAVLTDATYRKRLGL